MKAERFDEYHKYGCNFYGKLVVVDYSRDLKNDPRMGTWNAGVTFDCAERAKALVTEKYGEHKVLLSIPEYVCEVK